MALMTRFYGLWRDEGHQPADALHAAQRWLRDATNDELCALIPELATRRPTRRAAADFWGRAHPFAAVRHWAAFSYVGA